MVAATCTLRAQGGRPGAAAVSPGAATRRPGVPPHPPDQQPFGRPITRAVVFCGRGGL
jgi:hypothetical protein